MVELRGEITGDASGLIRAARAAENALQRTARVGERVGRGLSDAFSAVARSATRIGVAFGAAGVAVAAFGASAVATFARFERSFAQVRTLVDESITDVEALADGVRELSVAFGVDLIEATEAAYQAISAGVEPAEVVDFLNVAFQAAAAGATDVGSAVDLLTTVMNSFAGEALSAEEAADILFTTIRIGRTTAEELSGALGRVGPIAAAAGIEFSEVAAALAVLTQAGLSTDEAVTGLRAVITEIVSPSAQASAALEEMGVNAESLADAGLGETFRRLGAATRGSLPALTRVLANTRAPTAAAILAGSGLETLGNALVETANASGAASDAFEITAGTLSVAFARAQQTVIDGFRELGEQLTPFARRLTDAFAEFAQNTREEFDALVIILRERGADLGGTFESLADTIETESGAIVLALRGVESGSEDIGGALDAIALPIAGAVAGFQLLGRVAETVVVGALAVLAGAFSGLVIVFENFTQVLLRPLRIIAEGLGLDELAGRIRGTEIALETFSEETFATADALFNQAEAAGAAAFSMEELERSFSETANTILSGRDSFNETSEAAGELADAVRDAAVAQEELAETADTAAEAERGLGEALVETRTGLFGLLALLDRVAAAQEALASAPVSESLFGFAGIFSQVAAAQEAFGRLSASMFESGQRTRDLSDEIEDLTERLDGDARESLDDIVEAFEEGEISAGQLADALEDIRNALEAAVDPAGRVEDALGGARDAFDRAASGAFDLSGQVDELAGVLEGEAARALKDLVEAFREGEISAALFRKELAILQDQAAAVGESIVEATRSAREFTTVGGTTGTTLSTTEPGLFQFFGIQQQARAQPGQRRTVTGRPINPETGRPAPRGFLSFDLGGPVRTDQLARLQAGETVLSRGGLAQLGALVAGDLNRPVQTVNVSPTFNISGMGSPSDLKDTARSLLPELERATMRGVAGKSVL